MSLIQQLCSSIEIEPTKDKNLAREQSEASPTENYTRLTGGRVTHDEKFDKSEVCRRRNQTTKSHSR